MFSVVPAVDALGQWTSWTTSIRCSIREKIDVGWKTGLSSEHQIRRIKSFISCELVTASRNISPSIRTLCFTAAVGSNQDFVRKHANPPPPRKRMVASRSERVQAIVKRAYAAGNAIQSGVRRSINRNPCRRVFVTLLVASCWVGACSDVWILHTLQHGSRLTTDSTTRNGFAYTKHYAGYNYYTDGG